MKLTVVATAVPALCLGEIYLYKNTTLLSPVANLSANNNKTSITGDVKKLFASEAQYVKLNSTKSDVLAVAGREIKGEIPKAHFKLEDGNAKGNGYGHGEDVRGIVYMDGNNTFVKGDVLGGGLMGIVEANNTNSIGGYGGGVKYEGIDKVKSNQDKFVDGKTKAYKLDALTWTIAPSTLVADSYAAIGLNDNVTFFNTTLLRGQKKETRTQLNGADVVHTQKRKSEVVVHSANGPVDVEYIQNIGSNAQINYQDVPFLKLLVDKDDGALAKSLLLVAADSIGRVIL